MKSASQSAMQEALRRRRAGGLDLTIIVGDPEDAADEKTEEKELGHAPEATLLDDGDPSKSLPADKDTDPVDPMDGGHGDVGLDKAMIERELAKSSLLGRGGIFRRHMEGKPGVK